MLGVECFCPPDLRSLGEGGSILDPPSSSAPPPPSWFFPAFSASHLATSTLCAFALARHFGVAATSLPFRRSVILAEVMDKMNRQIEARDLPSVAAMRRRAAPPPVSSSPYLPRQPFRHPVRRCQSHHIKPNQSIEMTSLKFSKIRTQFQPSNRPCPWRTYFALRIPRFMTALYTARGTPLTWAAT